MESEIWKNEEKWTEFVGNVGHRRASLHGWWDTIIHVEREKGEEIILEKMIAKKKKKPSEHQNTLSRKWKYSLQNRRTYLQILYLISLYCTEFLKNSSTTKG